jgi:hypothetical protein
MNRQLASMLILLTLTACVQRPVRDDSPANDLDVLVSNARKDGQRVKLPNGKEYCFEDAVTEREQDHCTGDLEDALYNANNRLDSLVETVVRFVKREKLRRNPCTFWQRNFSDRARCRMED